MKQNIKPQSPCILSVDHALLDIVANVDDKLLKKYGLAANGATPMTPSHRGLMEDIMTNYDPIYIAGGCAQNSLRMIQWLLQDTDLLNCACLGCVGNDEFGEYLLRDMTDAGVKTVYEVSSTHDTGVSFVLVNGPHRSHVTSHGSAGVFSTDFLHEKLPWSMVINSSIYYFIGHMIGTTLDSLMAVCEHAVAFDKIVCFNLGAPYVPRVYTNEVDKIVAFTDYLFGNGDEAVAYAAARGLKDQSVVGAAKHLAGVPRNGRPRNRLVVITQGPGEIIIVSSEDMHVHAFEVTPLSTDEIVDSNGAGDAFFAGFFTTYLMSGCLENAVEAGNKAASYIMRKFGFSLGPRDEYI